MIKQMLNFETFRYAVREVYSRQSTQKAINEFKTNIELFAEQNRASANMNFVGSTYRVKNFPYEYDEALEYIRSIIHARVEWFDNKMKKPELFTARDVLNLAKALKVPVGSDQFVHIFFASAVEENGSGVEEKGEE